MPIVPVIPVADVPAKPTTPKLTQGTNLAIGYPLNEGSGLPKDILNRLNPSSPPANGGWATTPWGGGYRITQGPLQLGILDLAPPFTLHVMFKPDFLTSGQPTNEALIFGKIDGSSNTVEGIGLKWGAAEDTAFTLAFSGGQTYYSYTPMQPQDHGWFSVSLTYDGQFATMYTNGAATRAGIALAPSTALNNRWVLGGAGFSGLIADARVYRRVLSGGEINDLTSSPNMWNDYSGIEPVAGHRWTRQVWVTNQGAFRVVRRVAKIARR